MVSLTRARLAQKYIFFEMFPSFVLGVLVFLLIILMFQSFRLSEYIIVHGADFKVVLKMLGYLSISFLPVILPMSLLFSILLTYGRLSADSEIVAFKALGLNMVHLSIPAVLLSILVGSLSAQTSFFLAPWGNRQMEILVHKLGQLKPGVAIREGVFSEGFFNLVVYANKVDSKKGRLEKVFIYDERDESSPLTIIAKEGRLIRESNELGQSAQKAFLRLYDGNIHKTRAAEQSYTKLDFDSFDIFLFDPVSYTNKKKTALSYTLKDLREARNRLDIDDKMRRKIDTEWHRRWAISVACLIFGVLGIGLGTTTNKRSSKSGGFVMCLIVVIGYWVLYAGLENLGKSGTAPIWIAVWSTNVIAGTVAVLAIRKAAKS